MEEERAGLWGHLGALTAVKCHALMFHIATSTVLNSVSADSYWNGQLSFWSSDFLLKFLFWSAGLFDLGTLENFSAITFKIYYKWLKYGYYKFTESMYRRWCFTATFASLCISADKRLLLNWDPIQNSTKSVDRLLLIFYRSWEWLLQCDLQVTLLL